MSSGRAGVGLAVDNVFYGPVLRVLYDGLAVHEFTLAKAGL